jgi:hypothetical protein
MNHKNERVKVLKLEFTKAKDTKNTVRYEEVSEDGWTRIGTIYIQKAAIAQEKLEDKITVEIKPAKQD